MELQVISLVTQTNICIHLLLSPRWHIQNFESTRVRCIHLSYHDGLHYNSVRRVDDDGEGPAKPILLEMPAFEKKGGANGKSESQKTSNCLASKKAQTSYFEEQGFDETESDPQDDDAENICSEFDTKTELGVSARMKSKDGVRNQTENGNTSSGTGPFQQKAARNKACPCGSKKKYKACCAAVKVNKKPEVMDLGSSTKGLSNKARKQKLRHEKDVVQVRSEIATTKEPPDMGYLCI
ncbi:hypothetical protein KP509_02G102200 [Ceratopteris richardii]|nr:hypothetical protein KP509_02G102200 [Ceratopteris richardii]